MKRIVKESLILIIISYICNLCLSVPQFLCDEFGLLPFSGFMYIAFYIICVVVEFIVFSFVGFNMKFSYKSLMIFFVISMLFSILSTHLRGGILCDMLLNVFVISYYSFFKSLIAPACETIFKTMVLLISNLIARKCNKGDKLS